MKFAVIAILLCPAGSAGKSNRRAHREEEHPTCFEPPRRAQNETVSLLLGESHQLLKTAERAEKTNVRVLKRPRRARSRMLFSRVRPLDFEVGGCPGNGNGRERRETLSIVSR